jgi:pilus assembly protein CpaB
MFGIRKLARSQGSSETVRPAGTQTRSGWSNTESGVMNAKALIPLVAGLAVAGIAGKLGLDYVRKAQANQVRKTVVLAAAVDIPRGAQITESMLTSITFPQGAVPPGAFADPNRLVGRVPRVVAPAGLPVLETMLSPKGTRPGVIVPPGMRAVAVKIDESSGVDNHLQPGCRVDVVGYFARRGGRGNETLARTLVENVEVAAVGERLSIGGTQGPEAGKDTPRSRTERPPRAVTLIVRPDDVPKLHLAEQQGKIKLSMRSYDEEPSDEAPSVAMVTGTDVIGDDPAPSEDKTSTDAGGNWLTRLVDRFVQKDRFTGLPPADGGTAPPPGPSADRSRPKWTMVIMNGDHRRLLAWKDLNSIEPVELTPEGPPSPSLFEDPSTPKTTPPGVAPTPESKTEYQPQEPHG